jgi:hypothetical protein
LTVERLSCSLIGMGVSSYRVEVIGVGMGQMELSPFQAGYWIWGRYALGCKRSLGSTPLQGVVSRSISRKDACIRPSGSVPYSSLNRAFSFNHIS